MLDNAMLRETLWVEKSKPKWEALGHVPQDDLIRYVREYVPAMIRSAPDDVVLAHVVMAYVGRTGVQYVHELLRWEVCGRPEDEQITLFAEMMGREAMQVSARTRVHKVFFDLELRNMNET